MSTCLCLLARRVCQNRRLLKLKRAVKNAQTHLLFRTYGRLCRTATMETVDLWAEYYKTKERVSGTCNLVLMAGLLT